MTKPPTANLADELKHLANAAKRLHVGGEHAGSHGLRAAMHETKSPGSPEKNMARPTSFKPKEAVAERNPLDMVSQKINDDMTQARSVLMKSFEDGHRQLGADGGSMAHKLHPEGYDAKGPGSPEKNMAHPPSFKPKEVVAQGNPLDLVSQQIADDMHAARNVLIKNIGDGNRLLGVEGGSAKHKLDTVKPTRDAENIAHPQRAPHNGVKTIAPVNPGAGDKSWSDFIIESQSPATFRPRQPNR
jgi:hypothetical protein